VLITLIARGKRNRQTFPFSFSLVRSFLDQIYSNSILSNLTFGGARTYFTAGHPFPPNSNPTAVRMVLLNHLHFRAILGTSPCPQGRQTGGSHTSAKSTANNIHPHLSARPHVSWKSFDTKATTYAPYPSSTSLSPFRFPRWIGIPIITPMTKTLNATSSSFVLRKAILVSEKIPDSVAL
jgi:hypothetical protein